MTDPTPIPGRVALADGTTIDVTAVYFGLDADGISIYRAMVTVPSMGAIADGDVYFESIPTRSRIELLLAPPGFITGEPLVQLQSHTSDTYCPTCRALLNGATDTGHGRPPKPGAVTLCVYCAGVAIYDDQMQLRHPTDAELIGLQADPDFVRARAAVHAMIAKRGRDG